VLAKEGEVLRRV
jgi:hypothetical protein